MGRGERSIEARIRSWEFRFYDSLTTLLKTKFHNSLPPWRRVHPLRLLSLDKDQVLRHLRGLATARPDPPFTEIAEISDQEDDSEGEL